LVLCGCEGHLFDWSESVAVYLRLHSSSQCKLSGMFVNLIPPVTVTFDELFHFDFAVKPRRQNMYYFLRIELIAFDLEHPQVSSQLSTYVGHENVGHTLDHYNAVTRP